MTRTNITTDRFSVRNFPYSLYFDGSTSYVNIGLNTWDFDYNEKFSIAFWMNYSKTGAQQCIIGNGENATPFKGWTLIENGTGGLFLLLRYGATASQAIQVNFASDVLKSGVWYHIVATYDGSSNATGIKFYLNASSVSTTIVYNSAASTMVGSSNASIGSRNNTDNFYKGFLGNIQVLRGIELSAIDVQDLYYQYVNNYTPNNWYKFLSGSGSSLVDYGSDGNNGTIVNATWASNTPFKSRTSISTPRISVRNYPYTLFFNGSSAIVDLGVNYSFERTDSFTIFGYTNFADVTPHSNSQTLIGNRSISDQKGWSALASSTKNGSIDFIFGNSVGNRIYVSSENVVFTPGTPTFWAITYDGSSAASGVTFYVVPVGSALTSAVTKGTPTSNSLTLTTVSTSSLMIGRTPGGSANNYLSARQSKIGVISGISCSLSQIQGIYYNDKLPSGYTNSTWLGSNAIGSGGTLYDESGSVNGTITSATWSTISPLKARS